MPPPMPPMASMGMPTAPPIAIMSDFGAIPKSLPQPKP